MEYAILELDGARTGDHRLHNRAHRKRLAVTITRNRRRKKTRDFERENDQRGLRLGIDREDPGIGFNLCPELPLFPLLSLSKIYSPSLSAVVP